MFVQKVYLLLLMLGVNVCLGNKYYISPTTATFLQALSMCRRFGMKLVTIDSQEKNSDLYNKFSRLREQNVWFWTSGIYQNNSMTQEWYWVESDREFIYTDWRQNDTPFEPKLFPGDNCLRWGFYNQINAPKGLWRTEACTSLLRFICEKPYLGSSGSMCIDIHSCGNSANC